MDLRVFFQKLRKIEKEITAPDVVVMSHETPDGGRPGQLTEVPRSVAARLILEGHAHLATEEQAAKFRAAAQKALEEAEKSQMASRVQVNVISEEDLRTLKGGSRPTKSKS